MFSAVRGVFEKLRMDCRKEWPADDADFTADETPIRMDLGFDPDFIGVEVCEICGPSEALPADNTAAHRGDSPMSSANHST
jgi:hypothetical protein